MTEELHELLEEFFRLTLELGEFGTFYSEVDQKSERHRELKKEIDRRLKERDKLIEFVFNEGLLGRLAKNVEFYKKMGMTNEVR